MSLTNLTCLKTRYKALLALAGDGHYLQWLSLLNPRFCGLGTEYLRLGTFPWDSYHKCWVCYLS